MWRNNLKSLCLSACCCLQVGRVGYSYWSHFVEQSFEYGGHIAEEICNQKGEIQQNVQLLYEQCKEGGWGIRSCTSRLCTLSWSVTTQPCQIQLQYTRMLMFVYVRVVVWGWNCYQRCRPSMPPPTTWSGCPCSRRICCGAIRPSTSTLLLRLRSTTTSRWTSRRIYLPLSVSRSVSNHPDSEWQ